MIGVAPLPIQEMPDSEYLHLNKIANIFCSNILQEI